MSVKYTWIPNRLKPGTYFARVVRQDSVLTPEIVENIGERTLIQPVDVRAVLDALRDEVVKALAAGRTANLEDFLGFAVSLALKDPASATSSEMTLLPNDVILKVNVNAKSQVLRRIRDRLVLEQVITRIRHPQIEEVFDHLSKIIGQYTPGGVIDVRGKDLELPADFAADSTQGVFFLDGNGATRAETYIKEGNKSITCVVPPGVAGSVIVEVRTTYGGPGLRIGKIENVPQG